ncbi:MAG: T9SS type A sorting domain-containing protein, partial [Bacteroidota bacterium]
GYEVGHIYDIFQSATLYGIDAVLNSSSEPGSEIFAKLYSIDPTTGDFVFVEESSPYVITQADLGQKISLPLGSPINLNANEAYLAMIGSYGDGGATNDLVTASSGSTTPQTTFYYDYTDQTWYYTTSNVMVRMNFDPILSINEIENAFGLSVYPNPANELINVSLNKSTNATISVVDVAGKVVKTASINGLTSSINAADLTNGVYYVTITDGTSVATEKVVIKK